MDKGDNIYKFLAFDCGATSGRAMLATFADGSFSIEEVYRFPNQPLEVGGKFYWDVFAVYDHFLKCLRELSSRGIKLDSIGIDTWGVDFGLVASDGTVLGLPRSYRDPYTSGIPAEVFSKLPLEELYSRTGIQIMDFNTIFQLYAQTREGFAPLGGASHLLFMPDLLSYLLTGNMVCEYTDASTSGMMDQNTRQFATELLDRIGVRSDILLPIVQSGTPVGTLRPYIARETGAGPVKVIAVAGHDTASAIAAVPASDPNFAYLSSGTWSLMGIETSAPVITDESREENYTNEGGVDGTTRFLKNITGMWLLEQCRRVWRKEGREYDYGQLAGMASSAKSYPGRIDPDDPRFANPADMDAEIRAALSAAGFPSPNDDAQMVACIYNSLVDKYAEVLGKLRTFASFPIERLHIIGGGSANDLLNQWTADALGIPVIAGPTEATAIGNVMIQARSCGLVQDRWQMRRLIGEAVGARTFLPGGGEDA